MRKLIFTTANIRSKNNMDIKVAISLFGINSGAALATVVGVLVEVPVMLSVVKIVNSSKGWYERSPAVKRNSKQPSSG